MIPLKDLNPTTKSAVLTVAIILACVGVYFGLQQPAGSREVVTDDGVAQVEAKFGFTLEWRPSPARCCPATR